jgi:hypothetical protein
MFNLYRKSQEAQYTWIRNHPVQYVAPQRDNTRGMLFGYWSYQERKETREIENDIAQQEK